MPFLSQNVVIPRPELKHWLLMSQCASEPLVAPKTFGLTPTVALGAALGATGLPAAGAAPGPLPEATAAAGGGPGTTSALWNACQK